MVDDCVVKRTDAIVPENDDVKRAVDLKKQSSVSGLLDFPDKGGILRRIPDDFYFWLGLNWAALLTFYWSYMHTKLEISSDFQLNIEPRNLIPMF